MNLLGTDYNGCLEMRSFSFTSSAFTFLLEYLARRDCRGAELTSETDLGAPPPLSYVAGYVSGTFISAKSVKHTIVEGNLFCEAFYAFFGVQVGDHDKAWAPHVVFGNCRSTLEAWYSVV